ncbi:MAG: BofC C-terminal domain-containing protein [Clostridiales bacterium]|nr:BofC C-terminal domain-containing protein [Clostridiales bacterium]
MKFKKFVLITLGVSVFVCAASVLIGYWAFGPDPGKNNPRFSALNEQAPSDSRPPTAARLDEEPAPAAQPPLPTPEPVRIHSGTTMIYEYYYQGDNRIETSEEEAPYFLLNMTQEKLREQFEDWQIVEFTDTQVVMRKNVPGASAHSYILGVKDNYVAVFRQTSAGAINLKEITSMPIQALSPDEQQKLRDGIKVADDEHLAKVLEDYGS